MPIDQYRKQANSVSDADKQAILARVIEREQVELSSETIETGLEGRILINQQDPIPQWFAD